MGKGWISQSEDQEGEGSKDFIIVGSVEEFIGIFKFVRVVVQS